MPHTHKIDVKNLGKQILKNGFRLLLTGDVSRFCGKTDLCDGFLTIFYKILEKVTLCGLTFTLELAFFTLCSIGSFIFHFILKPLFSRLAVASNIK